MKVIIDYPVVRCGTCGHGMIGEQHFFEAEHIIVHCVNNDCIQQNNKYKLPIQRIELEAYQDE